MTFTLVNGNLSVQYPCNFRDYFPFLIRNISLVLLNTRESE
jgi:hypothetical protein